MSQTREEAIQKLGHLIKDIRIAMLTTIDNGVLRSRPMATQQTEFDGTLWFMTGTDTHKMDEVLKDPRINVSYSAPSDNTYVSVSGTAAIITDKAKIKEMWNPMYKAWFPEGLDDPTICLLKVEVDQAEYWDSSSSTIVHLLGFIKAVATGKQADGGENEKINL